MKVWLNGTTENLAGARHKATLGILEAVRPLGAEGGVTVLFNAIVILLQNLKIEKASAVSSFIGVWDAQAEYARSQAGEAKP